MEISCRNDKKVKDMENFEKKKKKKKNENQGIELMNTKKLINRYQSRRERKIALQQDVDKLKRKLKHEENVHRALERAFTRPLGALPRLPPYLPSHTLELLAEVAVLEEEVVRLEEQVVNFRQGLYQEAIYISSSKKTMENASDFCVDHYPFQPNSCTAEHSSEPTISSASMRWSADMDLNTKRPVKKLSASPVSAEDRRGKENQSNSTNSTKNVKQSQVKNVSRIRTPVSMERCSKPQPECTGTNEEKLEDSGPNKLSEDILKCLMSIFSRMSSQMSVSMDIEMAPSISGSSDSSEETDFRDPYGICKEFGKRDIGPYKHLRSIEVNSIDWNLVKGSSFLTRRLKILLKRLASVDLAGLTHQQKLAFWINIYNSCMMNAFLEQGMPASPQMVVELMPKAMINVGGYLVSAMTIEHFILRLPYHSKYTNAKGLKTDEVTTRGIFGLDWPEPLVTFALSYGSLSSPAVRVYTASQVEKELEKAKRDYLQAAVGISMKFKFGIPKLLHWYLLDFAKDAEGLMDWICLQLPSELRNNAINCIGMRRSDPDAQPMQVLPYDFSFRYLLAS
ncbi:uncharacterized protein LOC120281620 isoform X1 [Dioscorea cayenensis subsp. rotundata]|uniref:Uncharacterized protein LOC120281620 isoform X1 n=2 Tax=Dioscorea cayennensis subsp. rotundata TaxID=55577 RepID=A0AB40CVX6_DIOCR|nr:uncharacterized protein LOC120281620 isoform X1 [Dioscorea cayenensis subsp. rotundata]